MVLVAAPCYLLIIIYSHFGVILSLSLHLTALPIFLLSLEMFMGQLGQIPSPTLAIVSTPWAEQGIRNKGRSCFATLLIVVVSDSPCRAKKERIK